MKTLKLLLMAGLALAFHSSLRAEISARAWLETYYLDPQPDEVPRAIRRLSNEGYFDKPDQTAIAIGFLATVFARHPDRVEEWLVQLSGLPSRHNRLLAGALWQSGHPLGSDALRVLGRNSALREEIERVANLPAQPVLDTPVRSASSMNLQWGAFLASGDERHLLAIFEAIGQDEPGLTANARAALAENAAAHPRVLEICRAQLERQPAEVRSVLRAALQMGKPTAPRS